MMIGYLRRSSIFSLQNSVLSNNRTTSSTKKTSKMAPLAGKYQHEKNENLVELMTGQGISEENAKKADAAHPTVEITVDGNTYTLKGGLLNRTAVYVLNEEVEESIPEHNINYKSIAKLNGGTLSVSSTFAGGDHSTSEYQVSDSGLVIVRTSEKAAGIVAKIHYKRV